jgi:hypothetical protein
VSAARRKRRLTQAVIVTIDIQAAANAGNAQSKAGRFLIETPPGQNVFYTTAFVAYRL